MKIGVSIPDPVVEKADALAQRLKLSRSAVFAMGVEKLPMPDPTPTLTDLINAALDEMEESDWEEQRVIVQAGARTVLKHTEW
jgi:hypothetical protein